MSKFAKSAMSVFVLSLMASPIAFGASRPEVRSEVEAQRSLEKDIKEAEKIQVYQLAQRLGVAPADTANFIRNEVRGQNASSENTRALLDLVQRSSLDGKRKLTTADVESADMAADTLSSIVRLKKATGSELHLGLADLVEVNKSWSKEQKSNFNRVLRRASEIAESSGRPMSANDAFQKALDEAGLAEKYAQGCKL